MKKALVILLAALMALSVFSVQAEDEVLYKGEISKRYPNSNSKVYVKMDKESTTIASYKPGTKIDITGIYPDWVSILVDGKTGYVLRNRIDVLSTVDPAKTPPYPTMECDYYAVIDRELDIKKERDAGSDTLSTLTPGARISIVGMENGWATVIWCKSNNALYGYIDTRELSEIYPINRNAEGARDGDMIATFTSFYNTNPDRIVNLTVTGGYISGVVQPGEKIDFNSKVAPFTPGRGYKPAPVLVEEKTVSGYGGGSCQVSSTLWDALLQLPGVTVLYRVPHGANGASYLPHGMDCASGNEKQNLIFRNDYDFPIRIDVTTHDLALFVAVYKGEEM